MRVLKLGYVGADVKILQAMLEAKGYSLGPVDGRFGVATERALVRFQRTAGLVPDGVAGANTFAALKPTPPVAIKPSETQSNTPKEIEERLRYELVALCLADVGEREDHGYNRSEMIDQINRAVKAPLGSSYCIGGVLVRGVARLCKKFDLKNPVFMTAGTQNFRTHVPAKYWRAPGHFAAKGDIGILRNYADKSHGHAFMVTEDQVSGSTMHTVEYNTDASTGSRDGDGVYTLTRSQSGTKTKEYMGAADVVAWILDANPGVKSLA